MHSVPFSDSHIEVLTFRSIEWLHLEVVYIRKQMLQKESIPRDLDTDLDAERDDDPRSQEQRGHLVLSVHCKSRKPAMNKEPNSDCQPSQL